MTKEDIAKIEALQQEVLALVRSRLGGQSVTVKIVLGDAADGVGKNEVFNPVSDICDSLKSSIRSIFDDIFDDFGGITTRTTVTTRNEKTVVSVETGSDLKSDT